MTPQLYSTDGREYDFFVPSTPGVPLPVGTYILNAQQKRGLYLERQPDIPTPVKIYGPNYAPRIMDSYLQRASEGVSTGVWLNGEKGSGKTMVAAQLSALMRSQGLSTILVQQPFGGPEFNSFIERLERACIIFDEFEKVYPGTNTRDDDNESKAQNSLLTMFAGSVVAQHLYVITTNQEFKVADAMRNRPTRMRYFIDHKGVHEDTVREYVAENLKDQSQAESVIQAMNSIPACNFDLLLCAVEEHNRFGGKIEDVLAIMNISRGFRSEWSVQYDGLDSKGMNVVARRKWTGELSEISNYPDSDGVTMGLTIVAPRQALATESSPAMQPTAPWSTDIKDSSSQIGVRIMAQEPEFTEEGHSVFMTEHGTVTFKRASGFTKHKHAF